ncbi:9488_t:CDS:2 [Paraglomus brasilianum]|uniref:9488_t:CDS:1 n=1 Tax=Paraglomus brasilianum TaxID=144538 RepID=A0A9N9B4C3_9GLOM|nr:9488_t:CDS:2 [Paraglomus brasilianum]
MSLNRETIVYVRQQEEQYPRSLLRRAWDTIENILGFVRPTTSTRTSPSPIPVPHQTPTLEADAQSTTSSSMSTYAMAYDHVHTMFYADDAASDDEGRALSRTSQDVIRVPRARNSRRYNTWKQENEGPEWMTETGSEERRAKELIANWAMGEVAPWFN